METVAIVISVAEGRAEEFEAAFRANEYPIWEDFHRRGVMVRASLTRMDISTIPVTGAMQYLVVAVFADETGHHLHDTDPRFREWDRAADQYQVAEAYALGGKTILSVGG